MFKGLGQMGDMAKMMKAAQEMQQKMANLQEEMHQMMLLRHFWRTILTLWLRR